MTIKVVRSTFRGAGVLGDYLWMIDQPEFARALFIFNDNEEQFDAYVAGEARGFTAGGGNAAIRPLRRHLPPRAAGVPTGKHGRGYSALDATTKSKIDEALAVINALLKTCDYDQIVVSTSKDGDTLGTGIYEVAREVRDYIFQQLVKP
ncbi:MAG: hypothetical protein ACKODI_02165 [Acidimicrobiaceae bacterium]